MYRNKPHSMVLIACVVISLVGSSSTVRAAVNCDSGPPVCEAAPGDKVCNNDSTRQCLVNADCGAGTCVTSVLAIGGTVTAHPNSINFLQLTGDSNLTLVASLLPPPAPPVAAPNVTSTTWRVFPTNPGPASGTVVATDSANQTCRVPVSFLIRSSGAVLPATPETICPLADNYSLNVNSAPSSPAGTTACSSHLVTCADVPPVGLAYLSDSRILSVRSPITGATVKMELTKGGVFDSHLRLLFSRSADGGLTFTPFANITSQVNPGSTRIIGTGEWSNIKVVTAVSPVIFPALSVWGRVLLAFLMLAAVIWFSWCYGTTSRRVSRHP